MQATIKLSVHSSVQKSLLNLHFYEFAYGSPKLSPDAGDEDELALIHLFQDLNAFTVAQLVLIRSLFPPKWKHTIYHLIFF